MRERLRKYWPAIKAVVALAILVAIGRRFQHDLEGHPELWNLSLRPGWLVLCGLLYVLGQIFPALYWYRLLKQVGEQPAPLPAVRTYWIAQLGKYLPGKAWALVLRATMAGEGGVRMGVAGMTAFYEVLATMASGVLVAAVLFAVLGPRSDTPLDLPTMRDLVLLRTPQHALDRWILVLLSLAILALVLVPILPPVFNVLVHRISLPFREPDAPAPRVTFGMLFEGLILTAVCWVCFGASLAAVLAGVLPGDGIRFDPASLGRLIAMLALAYVAGFVFIMVPSGLGVREFFLTLLLVPEIGQHVVDPVEARALAVLVAILLRLIWAITELVSAALVCWLPSGASAQTS